MLVFLFLQVRVACTRMLVFFFLQVRVRDSQKKPWWPIRRDKEQRD